MEYKDGNFTITEEEIAYLTKIDKLEKQIGAGYYNPQRLYLLWAYLNNTRTKAKKALLTPSQYRELLRALLSSSDADMRRNIEKYIIAFDIASEYVRGVGRGTYHYLAELYSLKANKAIFALLMILERMLKGAEINSLPYYNKAIQSQMDKDGGIIYKYADKTKEDIGEDIVNTIIYLCNNLKGFKTDIEGMQKYFAELIPVEYLEPFGFDITHTLPISLQAYIYKMEKGFIEEAGIDISETLENGGEPTFPTYKAVKVNKTKVEAQYRAIKEMVEERWKNE